MYKPGTLIDMGIDSVTARWPLAQPESLTTRAIGELTQR